MLSVPLHRTGARFAAVVLVEEALGASCHCARVHKKQIYRPSKAFLQFHIYIQ